MENIIVILWLASTDPAGLEVRHCSSVPLPADDDDDLHVG